MTLRAQLLDALKVSGLASSDYDLNKNPSRESRKLRNAAVLMGIVEEAEPKLILTKRSSALKHHPGQIAFPGGKLEQGETYHEAALREAREEISLSNVEVLGSMPPHETVTGFNVVPVIGLVSPSYVAIPDHQEVAEVFEIPMSYICKPENFQIESRSWQGKSRQFYVVPWGPYYVWGATARILKAFADRISNGAD